MNQQGTEKIKSVSQSFNRIMSPSGLMMIFSMILIVCMAASCQKKNKALVIPLEDTVRDQYVIADRQEKKARGIFDPEIRIEEQEKAIRAYQVVEERFPNDRTYTPAAAVKIASLHNENEDFAKASAAYLRALETYPEDEGVRVASLLGLGKSLDEQGRYEEAKTYFKLLIDEKKSTSNPEYREAVEQARNLYRQIR